MPLPLPVPVPRTRTPNPNPNPNPNQVYACMVHNLFDEYRYFPKYPDKPLRTTALLFGSLVQHGLVSNITLGMFLRYVLEALRKPLGSKMCARTRTRPKPEP